MRNLQKFIRAETATSVERPDAAAAAESEREDNRLIKAFSYSEEGGEGSEEDPFNYGRLRRRNHKCSNELIDMIATLLVKMEHGMSL